MEPTLASGTRVALLAAAVVSLAACGGPPPGAAATVNGETITTAALEEAVRGTLDASQEQFSALDLTDRATVVTDLQSQALTRLVFAELIRQEASELGIGLDAQEREAAWAEQVEAIGGEEQLQERLAEAGLTEPQAREQVEIGALFDRIVLERAQVEPDDLRAEYEANPLQFQQADVDHILVESRAEAEQILQLVRSGEGDFAELASERSQDPGSAPDGGALGMQALAGYVPEFAEAVSAAQAGDLVGPVQTQFGWHVIRVNELQTQSFEEVEPQLRQQRVQAVSGGIFQELVADADIEVDGRLGRWDAGQGQVVPDSDAVGVGGAG